MERITDLKYEFLDGDRWAVEFEQFQSSETLWLGFVNSPSIALSRDNVAELLPLLQRFHDTGTIAEPTAGE